jgi:hypothetical protein
MTYRRSSEWCYYLVDGSRTSNKLTAIEMAKGDLSKIHFYWGDDVRDKYDFTKEPTETLDSLIDDRVRLLRSRYRWLCLWYSGGYDSQTILNSFIRTGTRLDEITIFGRPWIKPINGVDMEFDAPMTFAQQVKKLHQPWLKITPVHLTHDLCIKFYLEHGIDWIYHDAGHSPWFSKSTRASVDKYHKDLAHLYQTEPRRDIEGVDKPLVNLYNGKWYVQVNDASMNFHMDAARELFYSDPEATKIYIKQAWLAVRWFESRPECSHEFVHQVQSHKLGGDIYRQWNTGMLRHNSQSRFEAVGHIKTLFAPCTFTAESHLLRKHASVAEQEAYHIWRTGLSYLENQYQDLWSNNRAFDSILSRPIYLKDFEPANTLL